MVCKNVLLLLLYSSVLLLTLPLLQSDAFSIRHMSLDVKILQNPQKHRTLLRPLQVARPPQSTVIADPSSSSDDNDGNEVFPAALNSSNSIDLNSELSSSFMAYAMSTILSRALPDCRDGLKPVHRRVLYAMNALNLNPESSHRKCARVVGEVLGKFHPHGDQSVYDALVRMAQDFVMLQPLVSGHGNFGSIDNDPPAAMRYTECKLSSFAHESLLSDIKENTVDFVANFDGNEKEPVVLPARLPTLLLNGASGIAVGMATSIPPHNLGEVVDALVALIDNPNITDEELYKIIPAPDFPTGALIVGLTDVHRMYRTGHGRIVMRAKSHVEFHSGTTASSKGRSSIVVTELPYMTNKAALLENIAQLVDDKKLDGISDLRDESDRDGVRVVIELKRDAVPAVVQNNLFKKTALQTTFSGNMLALTDQGTVPRRLSLRQLLSLFIEFRYHTIRRRTTFQLGKLNARAHIVSGMLRALGQIDAIIALIRGHDTGSADYSSSATSTSTVKAALMLPKYNFTAEQAEAILSLTLKRLTALEESKLSAELKELTTRIETANNIMMSPEKVYAILKEESAVIKAKHGRPRQSEILANEEAILQDIDLIPNERAVVIITSNGYIKRLPLNEFETQQRGGRGRLAVSSTSTTSTSGISNSKQQQQQQHTEDQVAHLFTCNDHDSLLFVTDKGVAYGTKAYEIPLASRTARGVPLPQVLPISASETITSAIPVSSFKDEQKHLILLTAQGFIKKTPLKAFESITARGLTMISLGSGDLLKWARLSDGTSQDVLVVTKGGFASRFPESDVPITSRTSRGVKALTLRKGDLMADMDLFTSFPAFPGRVKKTPIATTTTTSVDDDGDETAALSMFETASSPKTETKTETETEMDTASRVARPASKSPPPALALLVTERGFGKRILVDDLISKKRGGKGTMAIKFKDMVGASSAKNKKNKQKKQKQQIGGAVREEEEEEVSETSSMSMDSVVALRVCPLPTNRATAWTTSSSSSSSSTSSSSFTAAGAGNKATTSSSSAHVVLSTNHGKVLKVRVRDIPIQSRSATGVLLQTTNSEDTNNSHSHSNGGSRGGERIVTADIVSQ